MLSAWERTAFILGLAGSWRLACAISACAADRRALQGWLPLSASLTWESSAMRARRRVDREQRPVDQAERRRGIARLQVIDRDLQIVARSHRRGEDRQRKQVERRHVERARLRVRLGGVVAEPRVGVLAQALRDREHGVAKIGVTSPDGDQVRIEGVESQVRRAASSPPNSPRDRSRNRCFVLKSGPRSHRPSGTNPAPADIAPAAPAAGRGTPGRNSKLRADIRD